MRGKILHSFYNGFVKPTVSMTAVTVSSTAIGVGTAEAYNVGKNYAMKQFSAYNTAEPKMDTDTTSSPRNN